MKRTISAWLWPSRLAVSYFLWIVAFAAVSMASAGAEAVSNNDNNVDPNVPVRVAFVTESPYCFQTPEGFSGSTVDVLEAIAKRAGWRLEYIQMDNESAAIRALGLKQADIAIGCNALTPERGLLVEYSGLFDMIPLGIIVQKETESGGTFFRVIEGIFNRNVAALILGGLVTALIAGALIQWIERGHNEAVFPPRYSQNVWWAGQTFVAHNCGGFIPLRHHGKLIAMVLMIGGTIFTAQLTAFLTTSFSASIDKYLPIDGPTDFGTRLVGAVTESYAEEWLENQQVRKRGFAKLEDAVSALQRGEIQAVVSDWPVLKFYVSQPGFQLLKLLDAKFGFCPHAIFFQKDSPLRKIGTEQLSALEEAGELEKIRQKWFGVAYAQ